MITLLITILLLLGDWSTTSPTSPRLSPCQTQRIYDAGVGADCGSDSASRGNTSLCPSSVAWSLPASSPTIHSAARSPTMTMPGGCFRFLLLFSSLPSLGGLRRFRCHSRTTYHAIHSPSQVAPSPSHGPAATLQILRNHTQGPHSNGTHVAAQLWMPRTVEHGAHLCTGSPRSGGLSWFTLCARSLLGDVGTVTTRSNLKKPGM